MSAERFQSAASDALRCMVHSDTREPLFGGAPIVVFGSFAAYDWDAIRQRQQNIVEWLAENNDVYYVERLGATMMGPRRVAGAVLKRVRGQAHAGKAGGAAGVGPGAASSVSFEFVKTAVVPAHGVGIADAANAHSVLRAVKSALAPLKPEDAVAFAFYPSPYVIEALKRGGFRFVVHDAAHRYELVPEVYGARAGEVDLAIARLADVRSCDSRALVEDRARAGLDCVLVPQGIAEEFFDSEPSGAAHPVLDRLRALRAEGPLSGFVGAVSDVLDADLLNAYADAAPGPTVIIGPTLSAPVGEISPRVEHVGSVPGRLVAEAMRLLDTGLIPYVENERTDAVLPTKLVEYLASGCRVVSTPLREVTAVAREFPGVVDCVDNPEGWARAARSAGSPDRVTADRDELRARYSWSVLLTGYGHLLDERFSGVVAG
jgi:glycosyltransferase involved in cell wall biosynthesis